VTVTARLAAQLATTANPYVTPQTVVALPPSSLDPSTTQMRLYVNGALVLRDYDPAMEQP